MNFARINVLPGVTEKVAEKRVIVTRDTCVIMLAESVSGRGIFGEIFSSYIEHQYSKTRTAFVEGYVKCTLL